MNEGIFGVELEYQPNATMQMADQKKVTRNAWKGRITILMLFEPDSSSLRIYQRRINPKNKQVIPHLGFSFSRRYTFSVF